MGLDMYMVKSAVNPEGEGLDIEIGYWRKFRFLHNWMESKWRRDTNNNGEFNLVHFNMTHDLLIELKDDLINNRLLTYDDGGFFFGHCDEITEEDREYLLNVIHEAHEAIDNGFIVYYNSWW